MKKYFGLHVSINSPAWLNASMQKQWRDLDVRLVSVDVETTGVAVRPGSVTEIGWFDLGAGMGGQFIPPHNLNGADPKALEISRYAERIAGQDTDLEQVIALHRLLGGDGKKTVIVGSNPSFDQQHLAELFASRGLLAEPWQRRAIDVAQGAFWAGIGDAANVPGLAAACKHFGIDNTNHHAALDDALVAAQVFLRLQEKPTPI